MFHHLFIVCVFCELQPHPGASSCVILSDGPSLLEWMFLAMKRRGGGRGKVWGLDALAAQCGLGRWCDFPGARGQLPLHHLP